MKKIISTLLAAIMAFSIIQPFSPEIIAADNNNTIIITDKNTSSVNVNDLDYGEVFTDKSVSTGTITIDQHNFSTEGFLVQLTSLAKEIKEKEEPVDIMLVLDTTMSTSNPAEGYYFNAVNYNGSIDDFVIAINIFMDITMSSNPENRVGILCYGASNMYLEGTNYRLGSAPNSLLLPLGHYTNTTWTNINPYEYTPGTGDINAGTYKGGGVVNGKYLSWIESARDKTALTYLPSQYQSASCYWSSGTYTFRIESSTGLQKDGKAIEKVYNYGGFSGTYTMNGIVQAKKYLLENQSANAKTGMLIVLTDGEANVANADYINSTDINSSSISNLVATTAYNSTLNHDTIGNTISSTANPEYFCHDGQLIMTATLAAAAQAKQEIANTYNNAYIYTIGFLTTSDFSKNILNPETIVAGTTYYDVVSNFFKPNGSYTVEGITITNITSLNNYKYPNRYYYAENTEELKNSFESLFSKLKNYPTGDIVFTDTIDSHMQFSGIKGLISDGRLYSNPIKTAISGGYKYQFSGFQGLEVTQVGNVITWKIPQAFVSSKMILIFEELPASEVSACTTSYIQDMYNKGQYNPNTGIFTLYSNATCKVDFTITADNPFTEFNKTINKETNITGKESYVSKSTKTGNNVQVLLGNNGKMEITKTKSISISKQWKDNNNAYNTRPTSITYTLKRDGTAIKTGTITSTNSWSTTETNLPVYNANGSEAVYTIEESKINLTNGDSYVPSYNGLVITNTLQGTKNLTITKIWQDWDNMYSVRPTSLNITILQNGKTYNTITLSTADALANNSNTWQKVINNVPKYDANGVLYTYTIQEDTNNENIKYFYETPEYNQNTLTVTNRAIYVPEVDPDNLPFYNIEISKNIINENNQTATTSDFEKLKLDINNTYQFPIILKEMNRTVNKINNKLVESYSGYSGKIYQGIVTNKGNLIFKDIPAGKYEISEETVQYFNFVNMEKLNSTTGATFSKEGNKYYITISGLTAQDEEISIKVTNKIESSRPYDKEDKENNYFKK